MPTVWALDDRSQLHKDANQLLDQNLLGDEPVRAIIRGTYDSALVGTDRRAFVFKKGMFSGALLGKRLASYDYRNLSGVQLETGLISGVLSLQGPGIASQDLSYWSSGKSDPMKAPHALALNSTHFKQARDGVALLREMIARAQASPATQGQRPDALDQLKKLGELRDAGILTTAEFDAKKAEILSRM
jgi:hypothetical protein